MDRIAGMFPVTIDGNRAFFNLANISVAYNYGGKINAVVRGIGKQYFDATPEVWDAIKRQPGIVEFIDKDGDPVVVNVGHADGYEEVDGHVKFLCGSGHAQIPGTLDEFLARIAA